MSAPDRHTVRGHCFPPPRPTRWVVVYLVLYVGLPLIGLLALLDLLLYALLTGVLGRCYGLACWWS